MVTVSGRFKARRTGTTRTRIFLVASIILCLGSFVVIQVILIPWLLSTFNQEPDSNLDSDSSSTSSLFRLRRPNSQEGTTTTLFSSQHRRHAIPSPIDGYFNGAPLTLRSVTGNAERPFSTAHCIGDNYLPDAWLGRSCQFSFFCFNTTSKRYTIFQSRQEKILRRFLDQKVLMRVSSTMTLTTTETTQDGEAAIKYPTVSLGGLNIKWGEKGIRRLEWFPDVQEFDGNNKNEFKYYELPSSAVLIPFHSMNGANPGHLVWDDFLSIYNLLHMFDLTDRELLFMRYILTDDNRGLWASCDFTEEKRKSCEHMMNKFLPLMVGSNSTDQRGPYRWSTTDNFDFAPRQPAQSDLICARRGVAGIGALTDHGFRKAHGWVPEDYNFTHNFGRGGLFRDFRNFVVNNLNIPRTSVLQRQSGHRVIFSVNSSDIPSRVEDFQTQIELVRQHVPAAKVESYEFKHLSLKEQIEIANEAAIFVTVCGGGAVTGMFLPSGASVILYYHERGGVRGGRHGNEATHTPAMLDWDLYNSITHLRVHWLPKVTMNEIQDQMSFVSLIRYELKLIESGELLR